MLKEQTVFLTTMLLNLVIASMKLIGGVMFNFSSLIADSLQSFTDFFTDIISIMASKIGKKRANKKYPFGYGMIENVSNLVIGIFLLVLAIFVFVQSFQEKDVVIKPIIFFILIIAIILKLLIILFLYYFGKKYRNQSMIVSAKESSTDFISTIIVFIVSILLLLKNQYPVLKYAVMVGSILISMMIFVIGIQIIIENISYLLGSSEENKEVLTKIETILQHHTIIKDSHINLMKTGNYYHLYLTIELEEKTTLKQLFQLDNRLKKEIKRANLKIRFIEIEPKKYH